MGQKQVLGGPPNKELISYDFPTNILVWKLNIRTNNFQILTNTHGNYRCDKFDYENFINSIHKSVSSYVVNVFYSFVDFLDTNKYCINPKSYCLQFFVPIYLENHEPSYAIIYISPSNNYFEEIQDFHVTVLPLKVYNHEEIFFNVLKDKNNDVKMKRMLTKTIDCYSPLKTVLTKKQLDIFKYTCQNLSSKEIAEELNTSRNNILKYNIRITERLSSFFDYEFDGIHNAASFYKSCFNV